MEDEVNGNCTTMTSSRVPSCTSVSTGPDDISGRPPLLPLSNRYITALYFLFFKLHVTNDLQVASLGHSGSVQLQAEPGGGGGEEEHELRLVHREEARGGGEHRDLHDYHQHHNDDHHHQVTASEEEEEEKRLYQQQTSSAMVTLV